MKVSWLIEKRVILIDSDEKLSLTDFVQGNTDIVAYLDDGTPPIYMLTNFRGIVAITNTLYSLHQVLTFIKHPNLKTEIVITDIVFIEFMIKTFNQTIGRRSYRLVKTYEEAVDLLKEIAPDLPDLPDSID